MVGHHYATSDFFSRGKIEMDHFSQRVCVQHFLVHILDDFEIGSLAVFSGNLLPQGQQGKNYRRQENESKKVESS